MSDRINKRPSFFHHLHPPRIPAREARFRYTFGLGGISLYLMIVLGVTGLLEMFYYTPSIEHANSSLQTLNLFVPLGRLIRSLHYWAAQVLVITAILHMLRVVLTGAYKQPRRFNWLLGLGLLILVLLFDFTGYALRWDTDISWALLVGTNLLKSIPLIGGGLYRLVVGGVAIGPASVVRIYGWHVYGLTVVAIFILGWHLFRVRRDGGISSAVSKGMPAISRHELVWREMIALLVVSVLLLAIAIIFPPGLAPVANFEIPPAEAVAPWFFVWIQQLLRLGSPFLMGVLIPVLILVVLALLPYLLDNNQQGVGRWFNSQGRVSQRMVLLILIFILGLTLAGILQ